MILEKLKTYQFKDYAEASEIALELSAQDYICHLEKVAEKTLLHIYKDIW